MIIDIIGSLSLFCDRIMANIYALGENQWLGDLLKVIFHSSLIYWIALAVIVGLFADEEPNPLVTQTLAQKYGVKRK